jgi:hypothetical protein
VAVPDLSGSGYRFMGGRLVAAAHGPAAHGPAALYMYDDDHGITTTTMGYDDDHGTRLVMLTRPMATEQNAKMSPLAQVAINGIAWVDHSMAYSPVGSRPTEALHQITDEARRQIAPDDA